MLRSGVYGIAYRDKKVVGVFVRFVRRYQTAGQRGEIELKAITNRAVFQEIH
jgi:hypothetical protein